MYKIIKIEKEQENIVIARCEDIEAAKYLTDKLIKTNELMAPNEIHYQVQNEPDEKVLVGKTIYLLKMEGYYDGEEYTDILGVYSTEELASDALVVESQCICEQDGFLYGYTSELKEGYYIIDNNDYSRIELKIMEKTIL